MKLKENILCVLLLLLPVVAVSGQSAGASGLSFLKMGVGARNIAMGDIGSTAASDVSAAFYNPARMELQADAEIMLMHNQWIQDVRSEVLGVLFRFFSQPVAIGLNSTSISGIEIRTKPGEAEASFTANFLSAGISSAFPIGDDIRIGATMKYLYEGIFADEAAGWGVDLGVAYETMIDGVSLSAAVRNIGGMNELKASPTKLPADVKFGGSYRTNFLQEKIDVVTGIEIQKIISTDDMHVNLGGEIVYQHTLALRAGYQTGYESRNFTGGIGIIWGSLNFDYALSPFLLELGTAHTISINFKF